MAPDIVQRADIGMIQRGHGAGFAFEAGAQIVPLGDVFGQHFDRDGAVEPRVARLVHFTHPASPDCGEDLVRTEFAWLERHVQDSASV